jgi:hypothetical protein
MPASALVRAREVLQRLERYELDVFSEEETAVQMERTASAGADSADGNSQAISKAVTRAARRRAAAQASLFDLANQKVVDELRDADLSKLSADEAKQMLSELRKKLL